MTLFPIDGKLGHVTSCGQENAEKGDDQPLSKLRLESCCVFLPALVNSATRGT